MCLKPLPSALRLRFRADEACRDGDQEPPGMPSAASRARALRTSGVVSPPSIVARIGSSSAQGS
jgi:hypothetical protein